MLTYKFHKNDGDLAFYYYYPQGGGAAGTVSINKKTGESAVVKSSSDDLGNRFAFKLIKMLKDFFANNEYKESGTIAWY